MPFFRALACIWLIYGDKKIPHLKGEAYTGNSSYVPVYTNYIPTEFFINGIVSALLTVVNVICIFITAIIILKIKEVAAPYTSSPDLRRYACMMPHGERWYGLMKYSCYNFSLSMLSLKLSVVRSRLSSHRSVLKSVIYYVPLKHY